MSDQQVDNGSDMSETRESIFARKNREEDAKKAAYDNQVKEVKTLRQDFDATLQRMKGLPPSREVSLSITNVQQGIMWLGMELKRLGEANPYPNSYDPTNTKIEPTADNLKL